MEKILLPSLAGYVKIGRKTEKGYPSSVDYFIFKPIVPSFEGVIKEVIGEGVNAMNIIFLDEKSLETHKELRAKNGKIIAWGNKDEFYRGTELGVIKENPNDEKFKGMYFDGLAKKYDAEWQDSLLLDFLIPSIPILGRWRLRTSGANVIIPEIIGSLNYAKEVFGDITKCSFILTVNKRESALSGQKKVYPVISLFPVKKEENDKSGNGK